MPFPVFFRPPRRWQLSVSPQLRRPLAWLLAVVLVLAGLALFPEWRDPHWWLAQRAQLGPLPWLVLLLLQCLCAVLMLPSLPLVIATALLFPQQPGSVLALALSGVLLSALLIYGNARLIGLDRLGPGLVRARAWIGQRGSTALCLWCMAPLLPSDLGCYVAAASRMPLRRYLPAVLIGESVLCVSVIWGVGALAG